MSDINTPVTVREVEAAPYDVYYIYDADGREISPAQIVVALNAAPKRAFEELTVAALSQMLDGIVEEFGEWPSEGSTDDQVAWRAKADAAFLSRLQAFAAPVASVAVPDGYVLVHKEVIQFDITGYPAMEAKAHELSARSCDRAKRGVGVDPVILLEEAEELLKAGLSEMRPAPVAPAWQPIETAPMEGFFDVWTPRGRFTDVQRTQVRGRPVLAKDCLIISDATHWQPLPAAPVAQGGAEDA